MSRPVTTAGPVIENPLSGERIVIRETGAETGSRLLTWELSLAPGGAVTVPPDTVHHFANAGPGTARLAVETRPALAMEAMLRTAAALAQEQHAAGRRFGSALIWSVDGAP